MEVLKDKIKNFLQLNSGSGDDSGSGYGDGDGSGFGSGFGSGDGDGDGSGFGYGFGSGFGYSDGSGSGYGDGSGYGFSYGYSDGSGSGSGSGYGSNITYFNGMIVYLIDNVQTIITHINKNIAKGFILKKDFTLKQCYIVKGHNKFAHGETCKKAIQSLQEKIFQNMNTDEAIEEFKERFKNNKKYKGTEYYVWHHILTGSCKMGRDTFVKNHSLDLEKTYTVKEFIKVCENDYGGNIIKQLKKYYN